jgi:hypothetical protein
MRVKWFLKDQRECGEVLGGEKSSSVEVKEIKRLTVQTESNKKKR